MSEQRKPPRRGNSAEAIIDKIQSPLIRAEIKRNQGTSTVVIGELAVTPPRTTRANTPRVGNGAIP